MIQEPTCPRCHQSQSLRDGIQGNPGHCQYCGSTLSRPDPSIHETSVADRRICSALFPEMSCGTTSEEPRRSLPVPQPLRSVPNDTRITKTLSIDGRVQAETLSRAWSPGAEEFQPENRTLRRFIRCLTSRSLLTLILMSIIAGLGFCFGLDCYIENVDYHFSGGPVQFECSGLIETFRWLCVLGACLLSLILLFQLGSDSHIRSPNVIFLVLGGILVAGLVCLVGLEAGYSAGTYLPAYQKPIPFPGGVTAKQ